MPTNNMNPNRCFVSLIIVLACILSIGCKRTETTVVQQNGTNYMELTYENNNGKKVLTHQVKYYDKGKKFTDIYFNEKGERNGTCRSWFQNGKQQSELTYVDGKEDGKYTVWYENGQVYIEGHYSDGKEVGTWKFFDPTGKEIRTIDYSTK